MPRTHTPQLTLLTRKVLPEIADAFDAEVITEQEAIAILEIFGATEQQKREWLAFGNKGKQAMCGNPNCHDVHTYYRRDLVMGGCDDK